MEKTASKAPSAETSLTKKALAGKSVERDKILDRKLRGRSA
jgi:hypothetical protein